MPIVEAPEQKQHSIYAHGAILPMIDTVHASEKHQDHHVVASSTKFGMHAKQHAPFQRLGFGKGASDC
jgi:hypothetical protein